VKMNADTDVQYAFTCAIPGHFFKNYDGVLNVDDRSAPTHEITVGSLHHIACRRLDPC
jgi:fructose/tagatose bisphosphate aldolase